MALLGVVVGLALLVWSADRFVSGAAATANYFSIPPLLIGMIIVGFGTSAPEMVVSATAALQDNPGLAVGNAYGSNIANIALILGVTALIAPIAAHSQVVRKEIPILLAVTALAAYQVMDGTVSKMDAIVLLVAFAGLMGWSILQARKGGDALDEEMSEELKDSDMSIGKAVFWVLVGLVVLVASSRLLVWGAVEIARSFGVSDLIIGLTIVAVGTSLPELASSVVAARKNEPDIALGNVLGSNLFNTLAVVGIAGAITPIQVPAEVLNRDLAVVGALTVALLVLCLPRRSGARIGRLSGVALLACFIAYIAVLVMEALPAA